MVFLNGIQNFLALVNKNWTTILVIIGLGIAIYKKINVYLSLSNEKKIELAKNQVHQAILRLITKAELTFEDWKKAGSIKRSQVIQDIYLTYPILSKAIDQEALINWIDEEIDNALVTLRGVIANNNDAELE